MADLRFERRKRDDNGPAKPPFPPKRGKTRAGHLGTDFHPTEASAAVSTLSAFQGGEGSIGPPASSRHAGWKPAVLREFPGSACFRRQGDETGIALAFDPHQHILVAGLFRA